MSRKQAKRASFYVSQRRRRLLRRHVREFMVRELDRALERLFLTGSMIPTPSYVDFSCLGDRGATTARPAPEV